MKKKKIHNNHQILKIIYFSGLLLAAHNAFIAYIDSTFLSHFVGENYVGIVYSAGAIFSVFLLAKASSILSKFGNFRTTLCTLIIEILSLIGLSTLKNSTAIAVAFIIHYGIQMVLLFNFDVFLEHFSKDNCTGGIRGTFLTFQNVAWVMSPFIAGSILTNSDFWKIYALSALMLIPVFFAVISSFKNTHEAVYDHPPFWQTIKELWANKNIYKIFMIRLFLQFFFAWMVIYMPIYLNQHIGFNWSQIGTIFTIMLLPFVIIEIPLGRIADKWLGEKEILSMGFVVAGTTTLVIPFINSTNTIIWAIVLLVSRIGASAIEIMCESYFFKQVDDSDINIIGFYRNARPFAYIIAPAMGTLVLSFLDYRYIFLVLGIITFYGLRYTLALKDTK